MAKRKTSRLLGQRAYLAGPIDRCPDSGRTWRLEITPELHKRGIVVLDPLDKPVDFAPEDDESRLARRAFKTPEGYDEFSKIMESVCAVDLRMVNVCDFVIAHIDMNVYTCGTHEEITRANDQKKPVLIFCKQGKSAVPDWLWGKLPHALFFDTLDDVLDYLDEIAYAKKVEHHKRWMFFNLEKFYPDEVLSLLKR